LEWLQVTQVMVGLPFGRSRTTSLSAFHVNYIPIYSIYHFWDTVPYWPKITYFTYLTCNGYCRRHNVATYHTPRSSVSKD